MSATFHEAGYDHVVELVHQKDPLARRRLESLDLSVYGAEGKLLGTIPCDPREEIVDLGRLLADLVGGRDRVLVLFDTRYDARVFPYRPHHYGFLHRRGSARPPIYYAVNAVLGGVPDRLEATGMNNFETYLFLRRRFAERFAVALGNPSRFSPTEAQVFTYYGPARLARKVALDPKAHVEVPLSPEHEGRPLDRVEVKALFRLASYVVGRHAGSGDLALFDHMFTYFK